MSSPLSRLGLGPRGQPRTLRVMVLGQAGVGKSALVVRFITKRYIGEYDPTLEKVYHFQTVMDGEAVLFEILDTAGQSHESECVTLEANIRWAEAFVLMYSVTDKCSFDECNRLKFLINYNKRRRRLGPATHKEPVGEAPVVLVGNKTDQWGERMVSREEGLRRCRDTACAAFHELSVRESIEQVWAVFRDVYRLWRLHAKGARLCRSRSELSSAAAVALLGRRWTEVELDEEGEAEAGGDQPAGRAAANVSVDTLPAFRARASTDGHLLSRPRLWKLPHPHNQPRTERRMSISMRGNNASC
ncbi:ras-related and estrogen-regulated growth inhibitor isoform X1 [Schistocerca serialis cubense]|uniref:ras-related and estrogen-regulated growth inhibitor isoform X1 n=1 Tax=Schistocerca serialis cubense TaxID=2023355 RepID=UPI00214EC501|nr:ras-related and estrogen-regulated growth inhibitor isoform X1 [Schistocerca serialis cubense]